MRLRACMPMYACVRTCVHVDVCLHAYVLACLIAQLLVQVPIGYVPVSASGGTSSYPRRTRPMASPQTIDVAQHFHTQGERGLLLGQTPSTWPKILLPKTDAAYG